MYKLSEYKTTNNILLIEDNPGDARLVEILLEDSDLNCEITHEETLAAGVKALGQCDFSAVLLDLTLPDSKGFITLENILNAFPEANVIVLTGLSSKEMGIKAVQVGAQDFLVKGDFDSEQLSKSLKYSIERKNVLKKLEEAQQIAHIGNWKYLENTRIFEASDELYRVFGYAARIPATMDTLRKHLPNNDISFFFDVMEKFQTQSEVRRDITINRLDGERRTLSVICRRDKNENGIYTYSGILQDVTERENTKKALIKSQARYRTIFSQTKDAIYISTKEGELIDYNEATVNLLGYSREELRYMNIHDIFQIQNDKDAFLEEMRANSFAKDFEAPLMTKSGKIIHCLVSASIIDTDEFEGYHSIVRNITERKQAENLRKAKELAERSAKMKEQFLANISHEMRTPMNAILGMSNLLLHSELDREQNSYITSIKQSSQNLLGIINDILEISSLQHGNVQLRQKGFKLRELVQNLVNVVSYRAKQKGLELILHIEDNIEDLLIGDALRVNQILMNLVGNAVKFTDSGIVKILVRNGGENEESAKIIFDVIDSGIGIPNDKLDAVFETFVRVENSKGKLYPGTGLGLSICKQLVEMQGGVINVTSEEGVGSTFSVEMSFKKSNIEPEEISTAEQKPSRVKLTLNRPARILLAEDHRINQIVAKKTLEKEFDNNVEVTIAENGQIAVNMLKEADFDIILMDIQMPELDGYEATAYIRDNFAEPKRSIPIFAMTAHAHMAKDEKYKEYRMDECVLKPFEPNDLFTKIAKHINNITENNHQTDMEPVNKTPQYIDLSYLDLMSDGDVDMKKMMLELLFDEPMSEIDKMKDLQASADWLELRAVSHKMKST
ncbi:MAG: response regulator, partial [Saprospiraceae bacterium]